MKIAWTHTAHRTYMSQHIEDGVGQIYFVIKGIDDEFFIYAKRPDNPIIQHGHVSRLSTAKAMVQAAVDSALKAMQEKVSA